MTWCFFQTVALFVGLVCIFIELMHYYCVWCFQERTRQRTQDTRQCCVTPMVAGGPQIGGASPCELSSGITGDFGLLLPFSTQCIIVTLDCDLSNTPNDGQATGPVHRPHLASADRLIFMEGFSSKHRALIGQWSEAETVIGPCQRPARTCADRLICIIGETEPPRPTLPSITQAAKIKFGDKKDLCIRVVSIAWVIASVHKGELCRWIS